MLSIRLKPIGKKKQISYRLVVSEKRSKLKGKFIEDLGFYNPHSKESNFKSDRIKYWISVGAQPSDTIHNLLVKNKVIEGEKRKIRIKPAKKKEEKEEKKEEVKTEEKEKKEEGIKEEESEAKETKEESPEKEEMKEEEIKEITEDRKEEKDDSVEEKKEEKIEEIKDDSSEKEKEGKKE